MDNSFFDFMAQFEGLALSNHLRLLMSRAPVGCGIIFYFKDDMSGTCSPPLIWFWEKQSVDNLFARLQKLADEFKNNDEWSGGKDDG